MTQALRQKQQSSLERNGGHEWHPHPVMQFHHQPFLITLWQLMSSNERCGKLPEGRHRQRWHCRMCSHLSTNQQPQSSPFVFRLWYLVMHAIFFLLLKFFFLFFLLLRKLRFCQSHPRPSFLSKLRFFQSHPRPSFLSKLWFCQSHPRPFVSQ